MRDKLRKIVAFILFMFLLCGCSDKVTNPLFITNEDIHTIYPNLFSSDGVPLYYDQENLKGIPGLQDMNGKLFEETGEFKDDTFIILLFTFDTEENAEEYYLNYSDNEVFELTNVDRYLYELPDDFFFFYHPEKYLTSVFLFNKFVVMMVFYNENPENDFLTYMMATQFNSMQYQKLILANK